MNSRNFSLDEEDTSINNSSYLNLPYISIDYDKLFKEKRNTKYNGFGTNENIIFEIAYNQVFNLSKEETIIDNENKEHLLMTKPTKSFISKRKRGRKIANNSNNKSLNIDTQKTTVSICKCKKVECLNYTCSCLKAGNRCNNLCSCSNCKNIDKNIFNEEL